METGVRPAFGSIVNLSAPGHYFHWGFILISLANLLVIVAMVVLFVLALLLPFIHSQRKRTRTADGAGTPDTGTPDTGAGDAQRSGGAPVGSATVASGKSAQTTLSAPVCPPRQRVPSDDDSGLWTAKLRSAWLRHLPPEKMLPDSQPAYVASWIYVGALERAAIAGGAALALACDLLVVGEGSFLHISEVELGRAAPVNVAWLTAKHTPALALEAVVAAPRYEARSMQAKGLAHLVVPDDDVLSATRSLADRLASFDRATVVALKDSLRAATGADFAAVLERVTRAAASVGSGEPGERS